MKSNEWVSQICDWVLRGAEWCISDEDAEWVRAARAELSVIRGRRELVRWAAGGFVLLAWCTVRNVASQPDGWILATMLGAAVAAIDLRVAESRLPLIVMCLAAASVMGILYRRAAWRWGTVIACMLPLLAWWTRYEGPYYHDRVDIWYPLLPAIAVAAFSSWLAGRWTRRHQSEDDVAFSNS